MTSSLVNDLREPSKWPTASSCLENNSFDPINCFRKLTYNESSAKQLSSPAFYTDVCTSDNSSCSHLDFRNNACREKVQLPLANLSLSKLNGTCLDTKGDDSDDDDVIVILDETRMPKVHTTKLPKMCQTDSKPIESHDFLEDNANFTNIGVPVAEAQTPVAAVTNQLNGILQPSNPFEVASCGFSIRGIPFLDGVESEPPNVENSTFPLSFQQLSLNGFDSSGAACDMDQSIEDDLYKCGSSEDSFKSKKLNFKNCLLGESLNAATNDDSSVELLNAPALAAEPSKVQSGPSNVRNIDVIEISDSDDDDHNVKASQSPMFCRRRISGGERIMPHLIPLGTDVEFHDENNNDSLSTGKPDCIEVIDVPSSPEMPKLIPFTSETEEPPKIKMENCKVSLSVHNFPAHSFQGILQPKVVVKRLSFDGCLNQKCKPDKEPPVCYIHHVKKAEEQALPIEPDLDMVDGLYFYSFSSKSDMDTYCDKFRDKMSFQVEDDYEDDLDSTDASCKDDSIIIPTKTNDITQIKGWRTKNFANESSPPFDKKSAEEAIETRVSEDNGQNVLKAQREKTGCVEKQTNAHVTGVVTSTPEKFTPPSGGTKDMCAFVSEALEYFLKNESQLNVAILQVTNPNITPIPRNASILSLGNLRKSENAQASSRNGALPSAKAELPNERKRSISDTPTRSSESDSTSSDTSSDVSPLPPKMRKISPGIMASAKVLKKSRQFKNKSESPGAQRLVLRLRKENSGAADGYKIADSSAELQTSPSKPPVLLPIKRKSKENLPIPKELPILIKQTLFSNDSKKHESKLLSDFLTNLNRLGTRNDLTMLVNSNQTYFSAPVITTQLASMSVSAVTSVDKLIKSKRQADKPNTKGNRPIRPVSSMSKRKSAPPHKEKPKLGPPLKRKSSDLKHQVNDTPEILGKRSIRLPARFLDSAILAAGTEWVSPVMSVDLVESNRRTRKSSSQVKESKESTVQSASAQNNQSKVSDKKVPDCTFTSFAKTINSFGGALPHSGSLLRGSTTDSKNVSQGIIDGPADDPSKRITFTPSCICKNTTRVMAYDADERRLKCHCIDTIIEAIKTSEGLTDIKDSSCGKSSSSNKGRRSVFSNVNLHNYAANGPTAPTAAKSCMKTEKVDSLKTSNSPILDVKGNENSPLNQGAFDKMSTEPSSPVAKKPIVKHEDSITNTSSDTKNVLPYAYSSGNKKPNAINIPGTNKIVKFVVVPSNTQTAVTTTTTSAAQMSTVANVKLSPTKAGVVESQNVSVLWNSNVANSVPNKPLVCLPLGVKPPIFVKKFTQTQSPVYPVITGVYCSNPVTKTPELPRKISPAPLKIMSDALNKDGNAPNSVLPLNSAPVVFKLSSDGFMRNESVPQNFKSLEIQKDHIFMKSSVKSESARMNRHRNFDLCSSSPARRVRTEATPHETLSPLVALNEPSAPSEENVPNTNPQSLRAVKLGDKYILCPTLLGKKSSPNENIITLYPATDATQATSTNCNNSQSVQRRTSVDHNVNSDSMLRTHSRSQSGVQLSPEMDGPVQLPSKGETEVSEPSLNHRATDDEPPGAASTVSVDPCEPAEDACHREENDTLVDVESVDHSDLPYLHKESSNSSGSSLKAECVASDSSSCPSLDESSDEDNSEISSRPADPSHCAKLNRNKKSVSERNRRIQLRKYMDRLKQSDPLLKDQRSSAELLNATTDVVNKLSAQNFTLAMQIKVLLMKRASLLKQYKEKVLELNSPREFMREVIATMSKPPQHLRFLPRPCTPDVLTPAIVSKMKMSLKKKIAIPSDAECSTSRTSTDCQPGRTRLYELLKCDEKAISSDDEVASDHEDMDVDDPTYKYQDAAPEDILKAQSEVEPVTGSPPSNGDVSTRSSDQELLSEKPECGLSNGTQQIPTATSQLEEIVSKQSVLTTGSLSISPLKSLERGTEEGTEHAVTDAQLFASEVKSGVGVPSGDDLHSRISSNGTETHRTPACVGNGDPHLNRIEVANHLLGTDSLNSSVPHEELQSRHPVSIPTDDGGALAEELQVVSKWYSSFGVSNCVHSNVKSKPGGDSLEWACAIDNTESKTDRCSSPGVIDLTLDMGHSTERSQNVESAPQLPNAQNSGESEPRSWCNSPVDSDAVEPDSHEPMEECEEFSEGESSDFVPLVIDESECCLKEPAESVT